MLESMDDVTLLLCDGEMDLNASDDSNGLMIPLPQEIMNETYHDIIDKNMQSLLDTSLLTSNFIDTSPESLSQVSELNQISKCENQNPSKDECEASKLILPGASLENKVKTTYYIPSQQKFHDKAKENKKKEILADKENSDNFPEKTFSSFEEAYCSITQYCHKHGFNFKSNNENYRKDGHSSSDIRCVHTSTCPWTVQIYRQIDDNQWIFRKKKLEHNHLVNTSSTDKSVTLKKKYIVEYPDVSMYNSMPLGPFNTYEEGYERITRWCQGKGIQLMEGAKIFRKDEGPIGISLRCQQCAPCNQDRANNLMVEPCKWKVHLVKPPRERNWLILKKHMSHNHETSKDTSSFNSIISMKKKKTRVKPTVKNTLIAATSIHLKKTGSLNNISYNGFPMGPYKNVEVAIQDIRKWCLGKGFRVVPVTKASRKGNNTDKGHYLTEICCAHGKAKNGNKSTEILMNYFCPWKVQIFRKINSNIWIIKQKNTTHNHQIDDINHPIAKYNFLPGLKREQKINPDGKPIQSQDKILRESSISPEKENNNDANSIVSNLKEFLSHLIDNRLENMQTQLNNIEGQVDQMQREVKSSLSQTSHFPPQHHEQMLVLESDDFICKFQGLEKKVNQLLGMNQMDFINT